MKHLVRPKATERRRATRSVDLRDDPARCVLDEAIAPQTFLCQAFGIKPIDFGDGQLRSGVLLQEQLREQAQSHYNATDGDRFDVTVMHGVNYFLAFGFLETYVIAKDEEQAAELALKKVSSAFLPGDRWTYLVVGSRVSGGSTVILYAPSTYLGQLVEADHE
jgi:hypothetical protein